MLTVDPFFFLVLVELPVVLAGLILYFVFQRKKYRTLYHGVMRDLEKTRIAREELKNQQAAMTADAAAVSPAPHATDLENCKKEVSALTGQLNEKSKLLEDLRVKLEGVEKEYLILYQKHAEKSGEVANS